MINDDDREMSAVRQDSPTSKSRSIGALKEPREQIEKIYQGTAKVAGRRVERRGRDPLGTRLQKDVPKICTRRWNPELLGQD
jgi:hypothetical protein